ncbi:MAG: hypothetical protein MJ226_04620 [archaeon]|nr:hypothetical protein [archaeon]
MYWRYMKTILKTFLLIIIGFSFTACGVKDYQSSTGVTVNRSVSVEIPTYDTGDPEDPDELEIPVYEERAYTVLHEIESDTILGVYEALSDAINHDLYHDHPMFVEYDDEKYMVTGLGFCLEEFYHNGERFERGLFAQTPTKSVFIGIVYYSKNSGKYYLMTNKEMDNYGFVLEDLNVLYRYRPFSYR